MQDEEFAGRRLHSRKDHIMQGFILRAMESHGKFLTGHDPTRCNFCKASCFTDTSVLT